VVYKQFVFDMNALNATYASGWQEAAAGSIPGVVVTRSWTLDEDEGYFKERLAKGHAELVRTWQEQSSRLTAQFPKTDLLGALLVAAQVFDHPPRDRKEVLMIFSDMRQATSVLDR
jgi:hypothetical protein